MVIMDSAEIHYPQTTLPGLLPELFLEVCDLISPVDIKSLSICCHRLWHLSQRNSGNSGWPTLRGDEKFELLVRLERDHPKYFACYVCERLHRYDGSESFGLSGLAHKKSSKLRCDIKRLDSDVCLNRSAMIMKTHEDSTLSQNCLSIHQVKLAMKRFRLGPMFGISTESLSYTQVRIYRFQIDHQDAITSLASSPILPPDRQVPALFSIEAQICPEPLGLYIRMQDILLLDEPWDFQLEPDVGLLGMYQICAHARSLCKDSIRIRVELQRFLDGEQKFWPETCPICNTVCVIEALEQGDSKIALVKTRWVNLGPGLDHKDPSWTMHVGGSALFRYDTGQDLYLLSLNATKVKSPNLCYENQAPESFEKLRERNISYLNGERYKGKPFELSQSCVMENPDTWHISYKEPSTKQET